VKPIIAEGWIAVTKRGAPILRFRTFATPTMVQGRFFPELFTTETGARNRGIPQKVRVTIEEAK